MNPQKLDGNIIHHKSPLILVNQINSKSIQNKINSNINVNKSNNNNNNKEIQKKSTSKSSSSSRKLISSSSNTFTSLFSKVINWRYNKSDGDLEHRFSNNIEKKVKMKENKKHKKIETRIIPTITLNDEDNGINLINEEINFEEREENESDEDNDNSDEDEEEEEEDDDDDDEGEDDDKQKESLFISLELRKWNSENYLQYIQKVRESNEKSFNGNINSTISNDIDNNKTTTTTIFKNSNESSPTSLRSITSHLRSLSHSSSSLQPYQQQQQQQQQLRYRYQHRSQEQLH